MAGRDQKQNISPIGKDKLNVDAGKYKALVVLEDVGHGRKRFTVFLDIDVVISTATCIYPHSDGRSVVVSYLSGKPHRVRGARRAVEPPPAFEAFHYGMKSFQWFDVKLAAKDAIDAIGILRTLEAPEELIELVASEI